MTAGSFDPPSPTALWTLGYVSVAPRELAAGEIRHILEAARRDNPALGVTGLLVHCAGTFMQVLEGPPSGVREIFRRIEASPLHTGIRVLFDEPLPQREFADWAMLCKEVAPEQLQPVLAEPAGSARRMLAHYWRAWA